MTRETPTEIAASRGGRLVATDGRELPLASVHLATQVGGGIARVVITQRFENPFDEPLTVRYLLPLPSDGAVSGFAFTLKDERITGEVTGRAAARERFERALVEGRTAALLEQERTSVFTQQVGNVPPRSEIVAEIVVDQKLRWLEEGAWEWRFPTVVGPRYHGAEGRVPDAARLDVPVASGELSVRATLALTIADGLTGPVESPSHALSSDRGQWGLADGSARLDRDVVVRWPVALPQVSANVIAARPSTAAHDGDSFALLTIAPPNEGGVALARDLTFLIDTSGSMGGQPLAQCKRVMRAMIATLGPEDRIEMIEFGSRPRRWRDAPALATGTNVDAAFAWLDALQASGGTEMHRAVLEALKPLRASSQRQVILLTDGYIGFEREIVSTLSTKLPAGARLHTVGVGSAVNRSLTQAAARAGRGVELIVGLDEDPDRIVPRLLARTTAPLVTDLSISGPAVIEVAPRHLPDLFVESPALIALRVKASGGEVVVRGTTAEGPFERRLEIPALSPGEGPRAVAALFAREKVEDLEVALAAGGAAAEIDRSIETTGVEFQIATRLTSWVAVSKSVTVAPGKPARTIEQPHELPHGVSAEGLGLRNAGAARGGAGVSVEKIVRLAASESNVQYSMEDDEEGGAVSYSKRASAPSPSTPAGPPPARLGARDERRLTRDGAMMGPPPPSGPLSQQQQPAEPAPTDKDRSGSVLRRKESRSPRFEPTPAPVATKAPLGRLILKLIAIFGAIIGLVILALWVLGVFNK